MSRKSWPVSYTHLDVYKRQALGGEPGAKAVGAELRPCLAAHGADDGIGAQRFGRAACRLELHGVAAAALVQGAHGAAGCLLYTSRCV